MRRLIITAIVVVCVALSVAIGWFAVSWKHFMYTPIIPDKTIVHYDLKPGASVKAMAKGLAAMGLLQHPRYFELLARVRGDTRKLQAGTYRFEPGLTPGQLLDKTVNGDVIPQTLTIVEGWTFAQMMAVINQSPYLKHTLTGLPPAQIMARIGHPGERAEGRFFPDTYQFRPGITDVAFLQLAYNEMQQRLQQAWATRAADLPFTDPYQALILASLLEKESALPQERPLIAGVLLRRLKLKMPLQIDATVIYGMDDKYHGKITTKDLRTSTPYNTYVHRGLPPTPIALPSEESLQAIMHPVKTKYLYFVAKGDGSHYFSSNLRQHDRAVAKYQLHGHVKAKSRQARHRKQQNHKAKAQVTANRYGIQQACQAWRALFNRSGTFVPLRSSQMSPLYLPNVCQQAS